MFLYKNFRGKTQHLITQLRMSVSNSLLWLLFRFMSVTRFDDQ
jgi:hypothetical protein